MRRNYLQKKWLLLALMFFGISSSLLAQTATIDGASTSGNGPMGSSTYHVSEHIYLRSEINSPVAVNTPFNIEFLRFKMSTITAAPMTFTNVNIYLRTTTATTFTTAGTYAGTSGYTLVYSGAMVWNATGWSGVTLNTPFSYSNGVGQNLQMMVVRTNSSGNAGHVAFCANGNATSSTLTTCRRYNGITAPVVGSTAMALTAFRAALQIGNDDFPNDIAVGNIYTLGKMPIEYGAPTIIQANVINVGTVSLTNVPVNLSISGANTFSDVQTIASLPAGASQIVTFAAYSPNALGSDVVNVSVSGDLNTVNNSLNWNMDITPNIYSYKNPAQPNAGGVGFNGATGDFVAKFNSNIGQNFPYNLSNPAINEIKVDFAAGGQPYNLGIWDATGPGGTPGNLLWQSSSLTSVAGTAVIPVVPDVAVSGDYFVGVRQTGTVNVSFAYQAENPIRSGTFYFTSPTGGTTWNDFSASNSGFRFSVEVSVHIPVPPNCAINLSPADGLGLACYTPVLSWGNGGGGPTGYDVYLSTNQTDVSTLSPSALVSANQAGLTYTPSPVLSPSTTYYWTVIAKNSDGDASGCAVQSFTTGVLTNCYCIPVQNTVCSGTITNVTYGTINNTTTCAAPGYNAYPASGSTTTSVFQNVPTNLAVTCDTASIISVWIDYNHDGNFDASEWNQVALASVANVPTAFALTIPSSSLTGLTLMRIRTRFAGNPNGAIDACTGFGSGEAEDYVIDILPEPPCNAVPNPGNTVASSTLVCSGSTVNLSLQNVASGTGNTYQWQSADDAAFTSNLQNLGTTSTETATVTADKYYRCIVTCTNISQSGTSTPVLVNVNTNSCQCTAYCIPTTPNVCDEFITNVTFAGINQTSGCNYPYVFFSQTGSVEQGGSYPLTYTVAPYYTTDQVSVFFDWNHDGDFTDLDETYVTDNLANGSATIVVPAGATLGTTRMRVRLAFAQAPTPCGADAYSEAEDYCITVTQPSTATLSLVMFMQGYYAGAGTLQSTLSNQGLANPTTDCDDVIVELHNSTSPFAMVHTFSGILQTNGTISCTYPASAIGNSYYIVVKQRNHVETWSANPVTMAAVTAYNFSTAANKAFGDNQIELETGVFGFYAGDVNQDLAIDGFDYIDMDPNILAGDCGYFATDVNGDGCVDAFDFLIVSPNIDAGVTIQAP